MIFAILAALSAGACRETDGEGARTTGAGEPTIVTIWAHHGQPAENQAMRAIVAAFNEAHADAGMQAEITFFPDQQYPQKVSIAAASNSLPDVIDIDGPYVGPWAAEGILQPLDTFLSLELRDDLLPSLIEQGTFAGALYALGAFESALVVYYNRDITDRVGLTPPERVSDAWTWDEFTDALRLVQPEVPVPLTLHMEDQSSEWFTYAFSPLIWSNGGRLIDTQQHQALGVLNSASNVEAIAAWRDLFRDGLAEATSTNPDPFSAGLVAFDWTGHWMLPKYEAAAGAGDLNFGVMPLPRMGNEVVVPSGSWCWGMTKSADDREAAWQVIEWFLDPSHGIRPMVEANGAVPGRRSAFAYFPEYETMPRRLFREQLEQAAHPRPRTPVYLTLTSEFARALRDIASGAATEERLSRAAEVVQRDLNRTARRDERREQRSGDGGG